MLKFVHANNSSNKVTINSMPRCATHVVVVVADDGSAREYKPPPHPAVPLNRPLVHVAAEAIVNAWVEDLGERHVCP